MPKQSTEVMTLESSYPVLASGGTDLMEALRENIAGDQLTEFDIPRIKVPGAGATMWQIPVLDGFESAEYVEGVILKWVNRRAYWSGKFKGGNEPPQCTSQDAVTGVGNPGGACNLCPFAAFGSSENEESPNAQACKHVKLFFVLLPQSLLPNVLVVPPTSLKNSRHYMFQLSAQGIPHTGLVTRFKLTPNRSNSGYDYSQVTMLPGERLSPEARDKIREYATELMPSFEGVTITQEDIEAD